MPSHKRWGDGWTERTFRPASSLHHLILSPPASHPVSSHLPDLRSAFRSSDQRRPSVQSRPSTQPRFSDSTPATLHHHLNEDDIRDIHRALRDDRSLGVRYASPIETDVSEAESKRTWGDMLRLIIKHLESYQLRKHFTVIESAEDILDLQNAISTGLSHAPGINLSSYARARTVVEYSPNRSDADLYCQRMRIDTPATGATRDDVSTSTSISDRMLALQEVVGTSLLEEILTRPREGHTDPDGALVYIPLIPGFDESREAMTIENKKTTANSWKQIITYLRITQALDGTPWGLALHGNQSFRPFQYTARDEISTWILKDDEKYFFERGCIKTDDGVIKIPLESAEKIFAEGKITMFAFRLLRGMLDDKAMLQARILVSFIARICCDLHELRDRQAGFDPQQPPRDAFTWPDNGPSRSIPRWQREW